MKNTLFEGYEGYEGARLSKRAQMERVRKVISCELTIVQREVFIAYFVENKSMAQIALERGVNRSTVCRTLHRAVEVVRAYLKY